MLLHQLYYALLFGGNAAEWRSSSLCLVETLSVFFSTQWDGYLGDLIILQGCHSKISLAWLFIFLHWKSYQSYNMHHKSRKYLSLNNLNYGFIKIKMLNPKRSSCYHPMPLMKTAEWKIRERMKGEEKECYAQMNHWGRFSFFKINIFIYH